jgi:hypothetical protein
MLWTIAIILFSNHPVNSVASWFFISHRRVFDVIRVVEGEFTGSGQY